MAEARSRIVVDGRVQGVYFRESTRREAMGLGLAGWVRNLSDGRVEAVFEGSSQAVAQAVAWSRSGPPHAMVTSLDETAEQPEGLVGFEVRY
jgi:acylphosphatase